MSQSDEPNPLYTPEFIRVREAWFKAGAVAVLGLVFVGTLVVGSVVGVASLFLGLSPHGAATAVVVGTWVVAVVAGFYVEITARKTAMRGEVQIDRF